MTSTDPAPLTTVFVYGTLMPGERNEHVARRGGRFTSELAFLSGYRLVHLRPEGYPGLVAGQPSGRVRGFALTYSPQDWPTALPFLDALEGLDETPPLYTRGRVQIEVQGVREPTMQVPAWVYLYARPGRLRQPGVVPVPGGDWREVAGRAERGPDER